MKSVVLSIVIVSALVAAGIGGTFADFSDYEVSEDNYFQTGSMDLTISSGDGVEYNGANVPALIEVPDGWPDCSKDRAFDIHNAGENEQTAPWVYIHFKNLTCDFVDTKLSDTTPYAYIAVRSDSIVLTQDNPVPVDYDPASDEVGINEPQYVAIFGGVAGEDASGAPVTVDGIGDQAICLLSRTARVAAIEYSDETSSANPLWASFDAAKTAGKTTVLDLTPYDANSDGVITLDELICKQIYMFPLKGCNMRWMNISMRTVDISEDLFQQNAFAAGSIWENWPTNATQNQKLVWDIAFEMFGQAQKPF